jgi:hypothetical protein
MRCDSLRASAAVGSCAPCWLYLASPACAAAVRLSRWHLCTSNKLPVASKQAARCSRDSAASTAAVGARSSTHAAQSLHQAMQDPKIGVMLVSTCWVSHCELGRCFFATSYVFAIQYLVFARLAIFTVLDCNHVSCSRSNCIVAPAATSYSANQVYWQTVVLTWYG